MSIAVPCDADPILSNCETFISKDVQRFAVPRPLFRAIRPRHRSYRPRQSCDQAGGTLGVERREVDRALSGARGSTRKGVNGNYECPTSAVDDLSAEVRVALYRHR